MSRGDCGTENDLAFRMKLVFSMGNHHGDYCVGRRDVLIENKQSRNKE